MVQQRLNEEDSGFALLLGRRGDQEESSSLMIHDQRQLENSQQEQQQSQQQQQQLLMIQGQNEQAHQQFVIIQDRREHHQDQQQQMVRYEYSQTNGEKEELPQQQARQPCESEHAQLQVVTIGSESAAIVTPPLFYNPAALRTYPIGVSGIYDFMYARVRIFAFRKSI